MLRHEVGTNTGGLSTLPGTSGPTPTLVGDTGDTQVRQLLQFLRSALSEAEYLELANEFEHLSSSARLNLSTALLKVLPTRARLQIRQQQILLSVATMLERQRVAKAALARELLDWLDTGFGSGDVLYDVGASYGLCTVYAGLRNPGGRVLACEPAAPNFLSLCANVEMNSHRNVLPLNCALAAERSFGMLKLSGLERGSSSHCLTVSSAKPAPPLVAHAVGVTTLDALAAHFQAPTMLRLNCPKSLTEVLDGAGATLRDERLKSVFVDACEGEEQFDVLARRMTDSGFRRLGAAAAPDGVRRLIVFERAAVSSPHLDPRRRIAGKDLHGDAAAQASDERSQLLEIRGFLPATECQRIIEAGRRVAADASAQEGLQRLRSRTYVHRAAFRPPELAAVRDLLGGVRERVLEALNQFYKPAGTLYIDFTVISEMRPGDCTGLHADNEELDWAGRWVPNHSPWRRFAALLYLNSNGPDYSGGVLRLPALRREVAPEQGLLVAFPCGRFYEHEVTRVETGRRCSLAIWTTTDERYRENW